MILRNCCQLAAVALALAGLTILSHAQSQRSDVQISSRPVVEAIEFEGLTDAQQKIISERISLRKGDALSVEARHRVASELGAASKELQNTLTFSYQRGANAGTVRFKISSGC